MRLVVVAGPAAGHAFPAAALTQALAARGHESLLLTGPAWQAALARDGIASGVLPILGPDPRDRDFGFRLWGRAGQSALPLAEQLRSLRPDAVVVDTLTAAGAFAADLVGLPWVELIPHPLQDVSAHLPAPGTGLAPGGGRVAGARDAAIRRLHLRSRALADRERAAARLSVGLPAQGSAPRARLVATLPAFEWPRPDWPARTYVVGPMEWDPATQELPLPPGDGPLLFVSASTAPAGARGVLEAALEAAAELGLRLVCTEFSEQVGAPAPWARVGPGRQDPLLRAARVVVAGAGHGIVAKALCRGRPMVCVPGGGEQFDNAMRVRRFGAGLSILPQRLSARRLGGALQRLLADPSYAAAAARLGASGAGLGPAYAAQLVEAALGGRLG